MSCFVVKEALRVSVPSHNTHVEQIASHVLVETVSILVLFWNIRLVRIIGIVLDSAFLLDVLDVLLVLLDFTEVLFV